MSDPAEPRRGRPRGPARELRVEELVAAVLELGVETFTMKDIARRLGVSYQVLYRWVSGREEVLDLVADHLVEQITPPPLEDGDWERWLLSFALQLRRELLTLPGMALRGLTRFQVSTAFVRLHTRGLEALMSGGMSSERAFAGMEAYGTAILTWIAREQSLRGRPPTGWRFEAPTPRPPVSRLAPDERYEAFVRTIVAGIAARAAIPATTVSTKSA